ARQAAGPDRPLVLSCEPTFLMRWLIPRLGGLQEAIGTQRELRLVSAGGSVPFAREGIDLAIRRADFDMGADVVAEPFVQERVGPVCRPALAKALARSGPLGGVLLHTQSRPDAWRHWSELTGVPLRAGREVRFEHFYLSLQAAVAGAGVAIGPLALVADDLASGTLCAPRGFVADGSHYVLMSPRPVLDEASFALVLDWLRAQTLPLGLAHAQAQAPAAG
ncbi:LysR family transcriptional regulator, partial [Delftia sp. BR1]